METIATPHTVSVEIAGAPDCAELLELLDAHGLTARVEQVEDGCELEIRPALMSESELRATVGRVLSTWLVEHDSRLVLDESSSSGYLLRPPGD